ncbi:MAG: outer membrane lipoprotein carrier protein LolA [Rhodospirillum sp.]|nr:outer membrane lipoprotein carrier protein LolA [Rhodospirillum sp.]MCF8487609.1 outer membrane lipoprotein carrier protein LolA [Rhodospirillum sp.]
MTRRLFIRLFALFLGLSSLGGVTRVAWGQEPQSILPALTQDQRAFVAAVESYLNKMTTVQARFLQISSTGNYAEGTLYISRPNRMRLEYDPPNDEILLLANGSHLVFYDKELNQVSYVGLDSTPLGVLLREHFSLTDPEIVITAYREAAGVVEISMVQADDPGQGTLTLVFTKSPIELRQWRVLDAQNTEVTVSLFNPRSGIAFDRHLFIFDQDKERR